MGKELSRSVLLLFWFSEGKCRAGVIAGGVTGLLAGIGVAIPLGTTLFEDADELEMGGFLAVLAVLGLIGFIGGAWGGGLAAKCWGEEEETSTRQS
jgi:hypothetical protein